MAVFFARRSWYLRTIFFDPSKLKYTTYDHGIWSLCVFHFPIGTMRCPFSLFGNNIQKYLEIGFRQVFWLHVNFEWYLPSFQQTSSATKSGESTLLLSTFPRSRKRPAFKTLWEPGLFKEWKARTFRCFVLIIHLLEALASQLWLCHARQSFRRLHWRYYPTPPQRTPPNAAAPA